MREFLRLSRSSATVIWIVGLAVGIACGVIAAEQLVAAGTDGTAAVAAPFSS